MAFLHCEIYSSVMDLATAVNVVLPDEGDLDKVPVIMLLHGSSDNSSAWMRYTACEQYARETGAALIIPEVQRSFYTDMAYGLPYFTYIHSELPRMCRRMFGLSARRELNYIAGLSMGGYGALKCALTYPKKYAGCGSFSGAVDFGALVERENSKEYDAILGRHHRVSPDKDLFNLAEKVKNPPRIYLSCGEQDGLWDDNVRFVEHLNEVGIPYRFDYRPGDHNWRFWDQSLQDCLGFFFEEDSGEF